MINNKLIQPIRDLIRPLGLGKALLRAHQLKAFTIRGAIELNFAKRQYLTKILEATPIPAGEGLIEVHMLLHHKRIYEGLWSLYSFAYFCEQPCRVIIHSDGSLTNCDIELLNQLFPDCKIISRDVADTRVIDFFQEKELHYCAQFRQNLIFALKFFDPFFFAENHNFFLLDSDILFFSYPQHLINGIDNTHINSVNLYSIDNGYRYCLEAEELTALLGQPCIERFNPGILRSHRSVLNFERVEAYLRHPNFWAKDGKGNYYAELTLWAMELSKSSSAPLPSTYAICPDPDQPDLVAGHYCGGGYWASLFYTRGLPWLSKRFLEK